MFKTPYVPKRRNWIDKYNLKWPEGKDPIAMEMDVIRGGGEWVKKDGSKAGNGLLFHYKMLQSLLWPDRKWHKWNELELDCFLKFQYIGEMGCAGAGKSDTAACNVLTDWYVFPECTTVLVSSTELKMLELRIWGMIKRYHRAAKENRKWLPGHLVEGKQILIMHPRADCDEGRDFRNGIIAVPCKRGGQFVGLGPMVGVHNKRVRLVADELSLMPRTYIDSIANLAKCPDFKMIGLGNPNETTNAHGMICEPTADLGGWEGGVDQQPGTKTWPTRFPKGICIQLPGDDSPNYAAKEGEEPPFPFLITPQQMHDDAMIWGKDDWHFTMMNLARMPRGQGSRRVLTRHDCLKFGAFNEPRWRDERRTSIAFLDAAYRGTGGDRCIFGEIQFGQEAIPPVTTKEGALIIQDSENKQGKQILALIDIIAIPIRSEKGMDSSEDQIVRFVMDQCSRRGISPANFFYESGMKTSLVTSFARLWSPDVNSVDAGGKPTEAPASEQIRIEACKYYSKFVTELWFNVRYVVEARQFRGMTEEACTEFSQREWKMVTGNRIEVETKEEMKLKTGRSPDIADAVSIGVYGARQRGFRISAITASNPAIWEAWKRKIKQRERQLWRVGALNFEAN